MSIKIQVSDRVTFRVRGQITDDAGVNQPFDFGLTARRLNVKQLEARMRADDQTVDEFIADIVEDWSAVRDAEDKEVPFSREALAKLLEIPGLSRLILQTFAEESSARAKN